MEEEDWAPLARTLGMMQCCCRGYVWSTSSRPQVLPVHLWGRRQFTALGCKPGVRSEPKEEGVQGSSPICHVAKVQKRDKPDWSASRQSEFRFRGIRNVSAAWQYDRTSRLGPGSEG